MIKTRPREIGFVLWGHCQNLLDDPRIYINVPKFNAYLSLIYSGNKNKGI